MCGAGSENPLGFLAFRKQLHEFVIGTVLASLAGCRLAVAPVVVVVVPLDQAQITTTVAHGRMPRIRELPVGPVILVQSRPDCFLPLDGLRDIIFGLRQVPQDEQLNRQVFLSDACGVVQRS